MTRSLRIAAGDVFPLRRARGYAPYPVHLPQAVPPLLGTGAELKNTFCLTRERYAFLSHHIGDLENFETLESFERGIAHLERLFRIRAAGHRLRLAPRLPGDALCPGAIRPGRAAAGQVQHHHAHIAAAMAEHRLPVDSEVLGISLDGTGYGEDGTIWGGEFLRATYGSCERLGHLLPVPMPGGDQAVRQPWRMALAWLQACGLPWEADLPSVQAAGDRLPAIESMLAPGSPLRAMQPLTSSMGRLFDAAASLAGVRHQVNYEAQAAIEFEAAVERDAGPGYASDAAGRCARSDADAGGAGGGPAPRRLDRRHRLALPSGCGRSAHRSVSGPAPDNGVGGRRAQRWSVAECDSARVGAAPADGGRPAADRSPQGAGQRWWHRPGPGGGSGGALGAWD